jgi:hypothetical protein
VFIFTLKKLVYIIKNDFSVPFLALHVIMLSIFGLEVIVFCVLIKGGSLEPVEVII